MGRGGPGCRCGQCGERLVGRGGVIWCNVMRYGVDYYLLTVHGVVGEWAGDVDAVNAVRDVDGGKGVVDGVV